MTQLPILVTVGSHRTYYCVTVYGLAHISCTEVTNKMDAYKSELCSDQREMRIEFSFCLNMTYGKYYILSA